MKTKVLLIEPFFSGSHKKWACSLQKKSSHQIEILELPGRHWKWRMEGGAIELAKRYLALEKSYDAILVSDMLDLSLFKALTNISTPVAIYFHENQLSYPWSPTDPDISLKRDVHYGFINYKSALCADKLYFNSHYHMKSFFSGLTQMMEAFPDFNDMADLQGKSEVLPLGLDLSSYDSISQDKKNETPLILWNHRWEYDKNPEEFFEVLFELDEENIPFELAVLGESFSRIPSIFNRAQSKLSHRIVQWGRVESFEDYGFWLKKADVLPVTSNQDFFGISVVEAIYCNTHPLLPRRVAYPEHIEGGEFFYENKNDLKDKLRKICKNYPTNVDVSSYVGKYDWQKIIPIYDQALLSLSLNE